MVTEWPTDEPAVFAVLGVAHSSAFNATDSLFKSPVCEATCCSFRSLLALQVNCYCGQTNKD